MMKIKIIYSLLALLIGCASFAQLAATNTGILYITGSSDIFYAASDFSNHSGSALTNNGSLYVKQNLTNDQSSMAIGTGTLYLNGSSAQTVNGSQPFKTYHLNTNNGTGITLNDNLSVSGTHTFVSGMIMTSATPNYLIYEAGSSYTGDADSRHVNGWVKKMGTTNFSFPVGDAVYERTAMVSNLASTSEINCHYYTPTSNIFNLAPPLVQVHANEYWEIDEISGGLLQVTLNWDNSKVAFENVLVSEIKVGYYGTSKWRNAGGAATGSIATTGVVTSWPGSLFSVPFTFGFTSGQVLPLKIISFTGERRDGSSFLHWVTENEQDVDHYDVQRSYDATTFTTIGNVAARDILLQQQYDFEDPSPLQGTAYYRLHSVDHNGQISYSRIVAVSEKTLPAAAFLVLNPVRSAITVFNKTGREGAFDYRLFNAGGQLVLKGNMNIGVSAGAILPLPAITSAGVYILEIRNEKIVFAQKIVVEK